MSKIKNKNKTKAHKIELLAPAGNFKCLYAAVKAGADAVYFGLKEFSMRYYTQNFTIKDLDKIKRLYPKLKLYLTLNTIIYDNEISKIEKILKQIKNKVDAIICWDFSIIQLARKYKIPFHISTQASISNSESAKFYKKLGASRIILARELNLNQIKQISKIIPIEIFCHGALCVSISGRCFTSQFLHNSSANRGKCLQPCRKSYLVQDESGNTLKVQNNKIFSAKDLCTLPFIEKIKKIQPASLKIEGRNREPEYVYTVTKVYRQALDNKLTKNQISKLMQELEKVYNREFSSGFYLRLPTSNDFTSSEHGNQTQTKKFIGKIQHYWRKSNTASIKINTGKLKIGDELIIIGNTTFLKTKIQSMQINHQNINKAIKDQEVAILLPKSQRVRKNDDVYLIVKKETKKYLNNVI